MSSDPRVASYEKLVDMVKAKGDPLVLISAMLTYALAEWGAVSATMALDEEEFQKLFNNFPSAMEKFASLVLEENRERIVETFRGVVKGRKKTTGEEEGTGEGEGRGGKVWS